MNEPATEADLAALQEGTVEIRETAEEPVVSKSARKVEEVQIGKEATERTQKVQDSVRRTGVEVERLGASSGDYQEDDTDFRTHWQSTYGRTGGRYEDYDEAYRYGYTMADNDRYRGHDWSEVEPELRDDWVAHHPGSTWERIKDAVRYGAERVGRGRAH